MRLQISLFLICSFEFSSLSSSAPFSKQQKKRGRRAPLLSLQVRRRERKVDCLQTCIFRTNQCLFLFLSAENSYHIQFSGSYRTSHQLILIKSLPLHHVRWLLVARTSELCTVSVANPESAIITRGILFIHVVISNRGSFPQCVVHQSRRVSLTSNLERPIPFVRSGT